jgi:hypothetical protein
MGMPHELPLNFHQLEQGIVHLGNDPGRPKFAKTGKLLFKI